MQVFRARLVAAAVASLWALPLAAQIDYRNLDGHRPIRITDAYPVERFAFELSLPWELERAQGRSTHLVSPHLEYGIARNAMLGLGLSITDGGDASASAGGLWNLRREMPGFPAVTVAFEATQPLEGDFGSDGSLELSLLATRSIGRSRIHWNGAVAVARGSAAFDGPGGWWTGLAWDRTLFRSSTLVVAGLIAEDPGDGASARWIAGLGGRRQLTPTVVLHAGLERELDGDGAFTGLTVGLSHAFAVRAFFPGGRR